MSEETFVRELERRAEDVQPRHFGFEDVRTTAYRIRRRRRLAASGGSRGGRGRGAAGARHVRRLAARRGARSRPQPSPTGHTAFAARPAAQPARRAARSPLDLDNRDVQQLGVLTDGRIVVAVTNSRIVRVYGSDGTLESEHDVALNQITMSADDTLAAWIDDDSRVVVLESGVTEPTTFEWGIPMPGEAYGSIDAVYGSDCANDGCTVLGGDFSTTTTRLSLRSEPGTDLETSEPLRVAAVSPDGEQWAVSFPPGDGEQFGCSGVYFPATDLVIGTDVRHDVLAVLAGRHPPDGERAVTTACGAPSRSSNGARESTPS